MKTNKVRLAKKSFVAALIQGLGFILFIQIIFAVINFQITRYQFSALSVEQLQQQIKYHIQLQVIIGWIERIVTVVSFIIAGAIASWNVEKRGWLYGGLVGVSWQMLILAFSLAVLILYAHYPTQTKEISRVLGGIPRILFYISIPLTALGGIIKDRIVPLSGTARSGGNVGDLVAFPWTSKRMNE